MQKSKQSFYANYFRFSILLFILGLLVACGSQTKEAAVAPGYNSTGEMELTSEEKLNEPNDKLLNEPTKPDKINGNALDISQKLIRTADLRIEFEDYLAGKTTILSAIKRWKGYVSSESESKNDWGIYNTIIMRVPSENFDSVMNNLVIGAEVVESKSIQIRDVTEEYIDVATRLRNKREVETQYLSILKQARTIEEILNVNEHLRQITEEIESKEGRLKFIDNQVNYSTITIYFYQSFEQNYGFLNKILKALEGGWEGFLVFLIGLATIWPILLIGTLLGVYFRYRWHKRKLARQIVNK